MIKSFDGQGFTPRVLCEMRFSAGSNALRLLPTLERIHVQLPIHESNVYSQILNQIPSYSGYNANI
jgi:hypothetical protein